MKQRAHNNHIHPALYAFYLQLKAELGAEMVHRRRRKSATCIEIIFHNNLFKSLTGRLNTLPEAEKCGYWVVSRLQTKRGHGIWHEHTVYQLYLTPVHPKKRHETRLAQEQMAQDITFVPIAHSTRIRTRHAKIPQYTRLGDICFDKKKTKHMLSPKRDDPFLFYFAYDRQAVAEGEDDLLKAFISG